MWKTIKYSKTGKPLIDVNEQGVFYSYRSKDIKKLKINRDEHPYYCWTEPEDDGVCRTHYAHIEVAKAFPNICGKWFDGCDVHHKDGNSLNNEASNLIVCTKKQHMEFHRQMKLNKEKELRLKFSESARLQFLEETCDYKNNSEFTYHFYCRKSKIDKIGYSPIELVIYRKSDGKKVTKLTGFKEKPENFNNGIVPDGFVEFKEKLFS